MVLSAVFIPMAFFGVLLGQFIASSLSPSFRQWRFCSGGIDSYPSVMCNTAQTRLAEHHENKGGFFGWFNTTFDLALTTTPTASAKSSVPQDDITDLCTNCCRNGGVFFTSSVFFLPEEDQGVFLTMIQLPAGGRKSGRKKYWIK